MNDKTYLLAQNELSHYSLEAELVIDQSLPAFELRRVCKKTVIAAPDSLELLYGIYDYAERFCGWSFFEPGRDNFDASRIKKLPENGIIFKAQKPLLKRRGFIQEFPFDEETPDLLDWMAKNKLNYLLTWMKYYDALPDDLKQAALDRGIAIESGHHNFDYWIPGKKYGSTNPEFFAEIGGKRISPSGNSELLLSEQLCTTNPALRAEIVRRMVEYCDAHPEIKTISLIPNDGFGWCECENCSKFYDKNSKGDFYSVSAHVYRANDIYHDMIKEISARLHELRPDIRLTFCAYVNYCAPSENFFLTPGLAVHMAPYWRCINHAMDDSACETNARYLEDIRKWCAVKQGGEVNIYEYFMGVNFYLSLPMIHWEKMFREMQVYNKLGVDGILTQFHVTHWTAYGMNYRLMAQAARNEDPVVCIPRMLEELFGSDAEEAEKLYRKMEKMMHEMGKCHIPYPRSLFRRTRQEDFAELHHLAQTLAEKAPQNRFRRELTIWTEYLLRFKELADKLMVCKAAEEEVDKFLEWIHQYRDTRVFVHSKFDSYFAAVKEVIKSGKPWIHFNIDWEDRYVLEHDTSLM